MTQKKKKDVYESTQAVPQEQLPPLTISLKELFTERQKFTVYPLCQRLEVWPIRYAQAFIDSILLGEPVPPLEGYEEFNAKGEKIWGIIDGHQRITAILDFMNGTFKTWTPGQKRQSEPNSAPPVEPGKHFDTLSIIAKNYFLDYRLQINKIRKRPEEQIGTRFRRIQNQVPLSAAEKLNSYVSKARNAAERVAQHPFWDDFYEGKTHRSQLLQSSLYLLALEMTPGAILDLQSGALVNGLASGKRDNAITEELIQSVLSRLDVMSCVFAGAHFSERGSSIAMYQAVVFVEQTGYVFRTATDTGKLADWLMLVLAESRRSTGVPRFNRPVTMLPHASVQRVFWEKHLKTVYKLIGVTC